MFKILIFLFLINFIMIKNNDDIIDDAVILKNKVWDRYKNM